MSSWQPVALSAIHAKHLSLGAVIVENDGWQRPASYTSAGEETDRVRDGVGICDISPLGKIVIHGDIDAYLAEGFQQPVPSKPGGSGRLQAAEDPNIQELVVVRLAHDEALLLTAPNQAPLVTELLESESDRCAHAVDVTSVLAGIKITGPSASRLLAGVTEMDLRPESFPDMSCAQGSVSEVHGTLLRLDHGDLLSYDLYFGREYGEYMWDSLMEAGSPYGVTPFGTEALARLGSR
jgi:sarcosine oxidase subunit alpha